MLPLFSRSNGWNSAHYATALKRLNSEVSRLECFCRLTKNVRRLPAFSQIVVILDLHFKVKPRNFTLRNCSKTATLWTLSLSYVCKSSVGLLDRYWSSFKDEMFDMSIFSFVQTPKRMNHQHQFKSDGSCTLTMHTCCSLRER